MTISLLAVAVIFFLKVCSGSLSKDSHEKMFFSRTRRGVVYLYIKKKRREKDPRTTHTSLHLVTFAPRKEKKATSSPLAHPSNFGAMREERPLAPANSHIHLSSPACVKATAKVGATPSNTHLFRCFHIVEAPNIMSKLRPFLAAPPTQSFVLLHYARKDAPSGCGEIDCRLTFCRKVNQNCLAKTQDIKRWLIVSSSWSHRGTFLRKVET
jgi:hypothetical protein